MDQQPSRDLRPDRHHGQAIASMVLGILSLVFIWVPYVGCILALIAVALSAACINGGTDGESSSTRGMAIAGLVTGILGLIAGLPYACGLSCLCTALPFFGYYW